MNEVNDMTNDRIAFLTAQNPLVEDYKHWYSRIKFYSDTVVKIAENLGVGQVDVVYYKSNLEDNDSICSDEDSAELLRNSFNDTPYIYENCYYLKEFCSEKGIRLNILSIDEELSKGPDGLQLVLFGILNDLPKHMERVVHRYEQVVSMSKNGYLYLSSDAELSDHQYILPNKIGFLDFVAKVDKSRDIFSKLRGVVITEITDKNILNAYENIGISKDRVKYLPMVISASHRRLHNPKVCELKNKDGKVMILRNMLLWKDQRPSLIENLKGRFVLYDSSLPASRRKVIHYVEDNGGIYKTARYWSTEKIHNIIGGHSFMLGMSTPTSDRYTYKIVESFLSGTVCILPKISLEAIGMKDSLCQYILDTYPDIFLIDYENFDDSASELPGKLDELTNDPAKYIHMVLRHGRFINEYFEYNSMVVNSCIKDIINIL